MNDSQPKAIATVSFPDWQPANKYLDQPDEFFVGKWLKSEEEGYTIPHTIKSVTRGTGGVLLGFYTGISVHIGVNISMIDVGSIETPVIETPKPTLNWVECDDKFYRKCQRAKYNDILEFKIGLGIDDEDEYVAIMSVNGRSMPNSSVIETELLGSDSAKSACLDYLIRLLTPKSE